METFKGFIKNNHPFFTIIVYGYSQKNTVEVESMFDSGFSGFLNLPLTYCLQAGLILASTAKYTLADGSITNTLLCFSTIVLKNKSEVNGTTSISFTGDSVLLGMEFLFKLKGTLEINTQEQAARIIY